MPTLLAWQWISLRRQANDALVAAFAARDDLGGEVAQAEVRKGTVRMIIAELEAIHGTQGTRWYERPEYLVKYLQKPAPALPTTPRRAVEVRVPNGGARPLNGQPKQPDESKESQEPHASEPQPGEPEPLADHQHE